MHPIRTPDTSRSCIFTVCRLVSRPQVGADGQPLDIYSNFVQYGLPWPAGLLRMDMHSHALRPGLGELLDAVIGA